MDGDASLFGNESEDADSELHESESGNESDDEITLVTLNAKLKTIDHKVSNLVRLFHTHVDKRNAANRDADIDPEAPDAVPDEPADNAPVPTIEINAQKLAAINRNTKSAPNFAKQMICELMSNEDLAHCNCSGKRIKNSQRGQVGAIPARIYEYVIETTFRSKGIADDKKKGEEVRIRKFLFSSILLRYEILSLSYKYK